MNDQTNWIWNIAYWAKAWKVQVAELPDMSDHGKISLKKTWHKTKNK